MPNEHAKVLVIGLGNELRGDDALGRIAARRLRLLVDPAEVDVIDQTAPVPEMAEPIAGSTLVVFLDASSEGSIGEVVSRRLNDPDSAQAMTHRCNPQTLVGLARCLYGHAPPAFAITCRGCTFDFNNCSLSQPVASACDMIVQATLAIIANERQIDACGVNL